MPGYHLVEDSGGNVAENLKWIVWLKAPEGYNDIKLKSRSLEDKQKFKVARILALSSTGKELFLFIVKNKLRLKWPSTIRGLTIVIEGPEEDIIKLADCAVIESIFRDSGPADARC